MNKETIRYQRKLRKQLPCGPSRKKELLSKFETTLSPFLEDCPCPNYEQLTAAFGPPEEMASVLMEAVPEKEKRHFRLWQRIQKGLFILLFILVLLFGFYAYYLKEWTVIEVRDEVFPTPTAYESTASQEGD